jgi:signal transduction histidine kinase/Skp family chaperone for outer membrane proteins
MPAEKIHRAQRPPTVPWSVGLFVVCVVPQAYLRLHVFAEEVVSVSWGLPLLLCLWYPSRRLLWVMAVAFIALAGYKAFDELHLPPARAAAESLMQAADTLAIAGAVHLILRFVDRLHERHAELKSTHDELLAREEEINRQNAELQSQAEELAAQNEELERQTEELQQQSEELQQQSGELQAANEELQRKQALLHTMLEAVRATGSDRELLHHVCGALLELFEGMAVAATVQEKEAEELVLRAHSGPLSNAMERRPVAHSFAALVISEGKTAFIADVTKRPDLTLPVTEDRPFRSVLATPLRLHGEIAGVVEAYSHEVRAWTKEHFQMIEWVSAQCSLMLDARQLHRELRTANLNLDRVVGERTAELQEMVNELEHFSYTITHDLRAPLRAMNGYAEMLMEEAGKFLGAQAQEYIRRISKSAARMDQLITDALSYSQAVKLNLELGPLDAGVILREMVESYPAFQHPKAVVEIDSSIPPVVANPAGLTQCFSNLLHNAVKFVPEGVVPRVRVHGETRNGHVRLWFEDNGIGIAPDMQSKLFVMFQRLNRRYEGTGIGLALVRKVAERMGGSIGVESQLGHGSRFWIELKSA